VCHFDKGHNARFHPEGYHGIGPQFRNVIDSTQSGCCELLFYLSQDLAWYVLSTLVCDRPQGNRGVGIAGSTDMIEMPEQPANLVWGTLYIAATTSVLSTAYEGTRLRAASRGADHEAWDLGERLPEL
jgi:hypothetical protein